MRRVTSLLVILLVIVSHTGTHGRSVHGQEQSTDDSGTLHRVKTLIGTVVKRLVNARPEPKLLSRVKRTQVLNLVPRCQSNSDCVNPQYGTAVPTDLVRCDTTSGVCICNDCFARLNNSCEVLSPVCQSYSTTNRQCVDHRKSQKTAFLLSLFLSSVGAANFYIGDYLLAGIQLGLFVLSMVVLTLTCCVPLCLVFCDDEESDTIENCVVCIIGTGILMLILIFMVNACWYVADLAIFGYNGRADLNGCSLIFDL